MLPGMKQRLESIAALARWGISQKPIGVVSPQLCMDRGRIIPVLLDHERPMFDWHWRAKTAFSCWLFWEPLCKHVNFSLAHYLSGSVYIACYPLLCHPNTTWKLCWAWLMWITDGSCLRGKNRFCTAVIHTRQTHCSQLWSLPFIGWCVDVSKNWYTYCISTYTYTHTHRNKQAFYIYYYFYNYAERSP